MLLYKPQLFSSKIIIIMMGTRTDIHSLNEVEDSFVEDIQSTTYIKLYPLNTDSLLRHSETEKLQYSIECYQQYTSGASSRFNYISSMSNKFAAMIELQSFSPIKKFTEKEQNNGGREKKRLRKCPASLQKREKPIMTRTQFNN